MKKCDAKCKGIYKNTIPMLTQHVKPVIVPILVLSEVDLEYSVEVSKIKFIW